MSKRPTALMRAAPQSPMEKWKTLSSKRIFSHPRLTLIEDEVELPDGTPTTYLRFGDQGNAVTLVCRREDGKILVQKEYSHPPQAWLYQFPGGSVPEEEDLMAGANRELMEEAKVRAKSLTEIGSYLINSRRSVAKMHVYLAQELVAEGLDGDPEEFIESYWFTEREVEEMILDGRIINSHTLAGWTLYKLHQGG